MIIDKAVYRDGVRHECANPSEELDALRAAAAAYRAGGSGSSSDAFGDGEDAHPAAGEPEDHEPSEGAGSTIAPWSGATPSSGGRVVHISSSGKRRSLQNAFVWIGLKDPTPEEFASMSADLGLHPLAVEDAMSPHERAKIDVYDETVVAVLKTLRYLEPTSDVETGQLLVFLGPHYVLTIRYGEISPLTGIRRRLESKPALLARGPVAVLHGVLDTIVDQYVAVDAELEQDVVNIEQRVFSDTAAKRRAGKDAEDDVAVIYRLKREVLEFKRAATPLVVPLQRLAAGSGQIPVPKKLRPFFADILDHLLLTVDHADSHDTLLSDILTAHLTQVSVQQNDDMRKISAAAAMAVFPTLIAGIYGMNFENMPELAWDNGYYLALAGMGSLIVGMFIAFKRSGWL